MQERQKRAHVMSFLSNLESSSGEAMQVLRVVTTWVYHHSGVTDNTTSEGRWVVGRGASRALNAALVGQSSRVFHSKRESVKHHVGERGG